jgi:hypothetical protein
VLLSISHGGVEVALPLMVIAAQTFLVTVPVAVFSHQLKLSKIDSLYM